MDGYIDTISFKGTQYYREQLMFAASQMVLQATELGIGSVVVGGYSPADIASVLGIDTEKYEVGLLISFGYPKPGEVKPRVIRDYDDVVTHITL